MYRDILKEEEARREDLDVDIEVWCLSFNQEEAAWLSVYSAGIAIQRLNIKSHPIC